MIHACHVIQNNLEFYINHNVFVKKVISKKKEFVHVYIFIL